MKQLIIMLIIALTITSCTSKAITVMDETGRVHRTFDENDITKVNDTLIMSDKFYQGKAGISSKKEIAGFYVGKELPKTYIREDSLTYYSVSYFKVVRIR